MLYSIYTYTLMTSVLIHSYTSTGHVRGPIRSASLYYYLFGQLISDRSVFIGPS